MIAALPAYLGILAIALVVVVFALGVYFLIAPERAMAFATHRREDLPLVMAGRYFAMAAIMAGALYDGRPAVIAFVFAVMGFSALFDALIYRRQGKPYIKHVFSAILSAALVLGIYNFAKNTGAM